MKRILITGVNSYIGNNVYKWLYDSNGDYYIERKSMRDEAWRELDFSCYDVVYHVAGIAHVHIGKNQEDIYYKVNRDLTYDIAKEAKKKGVKQFIFMSSMIVYHESNSLKKEIIDINTKPEPNGAYGESKLQAEQLLKGLESPDFKVAIIRPPMIYGPNLDEGNFPKLIKLAVTAPIFPDYHNVRSMLYIDNLCVFVKEIIDREERGLFFPQNREFADTAYIVKQVAKLKKHRIVFLKALNPFLIGGSKFINAINKAFGSYYYSKEMSVTDFDYQIVSLEESINAICAS